MKIKEVYNDKETEIRISGRKDGVIELWIAEKGKDDRATLAYMSVDELLELLKECQEAAKRVFSIETY